MWYSVNKILSYTKGFRRYMLLGMLTSFLAVLFNMLMPQIVRFTVDNVLDDIPLKLPSFLSFVDIPSREYFLQNLWILAVLVLIVAGVRAVAESISRLCYAKFTENSLKVLRDALYGHIANLPYKWHAENKTGDIIQRCTSDVNMVKQFISSHLSDLIRTVIMVFVALWLMFSMNTTLATIAACFIPIVMCYSLILYRFIHRSFAKSDEAEAALTVAVHENLTGVRVVRAFGRQRLELENFDECNLEYIKRNTKVGFLMGINWGVGSFSTRLQVLFIVILGVVLAGKGEITVGELIIFTSYTQTLAWPVRNLSRIISNMSKVVVAMQRISQILDEAVEERTAVDEEFFVKGSIEFKNVSFAYDCEKIIKNVSFSIKPGQTIGILGSTGSGKSTLAYLLTRLYDLQEGAILIDGRDIKTIDRRLLRKSISLVLQESFLYSRTIAENIAIAAKGAVDIEKIREFAKISAVDSNIMEFENGYDTVVGERGVTLSGGQKQRVAIARALISRPSVIIFDDSMSAVDTSTDIQIRESIGKLAKSCTVILISHRISTLMHADKILVMSDGEIVEQGTHSQLMENAKGVYAATYNSQVQSSDSLLK